MKLASGTVASPWTGTGAGTVAVEGMTKTLLGVNHWIQRRRQYSYELPHPWRAALSGALPPPQDLENQY
ncbi:hypothetical protein GCM10009603_30180 [Nocardiopsis exhalans]